jgi:hypothetical protein
MLKTNAVGLYSFHLKFAYEAITMLLDLRRDNVLKPFERPLIVEARGPSYSLEIGVVIFIGDNERITSMCVGYKYDLS